MGLQVVRRKVGGVLVAGVLVAGMALPSTMMAEQAWAADASITVTSTQAGKASITYDVYQLFTADIDADDNATNIAWATGVTPANVVTQLGADYQTWLTNNGLMDTGAAINPQNAANYIASAINGSAGDGKTPPSVEASSFASTFAKWCDDNLTKKTTVAANAAFTGPEGFYLFVTTPSTVAGKVDAATNAIWAPVGGSKTTVAEKVTTPTVIKKVKEDSVQDTVAAYVANESGTFYKWTKAESPDMYVESNTEAPADGYALAGDTKYVYRPATSSWGDAADANRSQDINYRLDGTLPTDLQAYSEYWYKFTDTLDNGLDCTVSSVAVKVIDEAGEVKANITTQADIAYDEHVLTVEFTDLKDLTGVALASTDIIRVEYVATLNGDSIIHNAGSNDNTVYIEYSNNPMTDGKGKSVEDTVRAFTYQMNVNKEDKATGKKLQGAKFTIQVASNNSDAGSVGKYVQADGSLGTTAYKFTTNAQGTFNIPRIDEGTYIIKETDAPSAEYQLAPDTTVVLTSNIAEVAADETAQTALVLTGSVTGGGGATGAVTGGTASVTIQDVKETALPLTGGAGIAVLSLVGAAGLAIGIRVLSKSEDKRSKAATADED